MTTKVEATLTNGVLKPDVALPLPDQTRVRLTIEPIETWSAEAAANALERMLARLKERPIYGDGIKYTRDELHERPAVTMLSAAQNLRVATSGPLDDGKSPGDTAGIGSTIFRNWPK
jgi:hypothetical protein